MKKVQRDGQKVKKALSHTKAEFVSGKLPLVVVRQLGGVNKGVVVAVGALNDLPANLVFGFLRRVETNL